MKLNQPNRTLAIVSRDSLMRVEVEAFLSLLPCATPQPWDTRGSWVVAPDVDFENSRMRDIPSGRDCHRYYGGELVAESCSRADAAVIAAAGNLLPRLARRYLDAIEENDRLAERIALLTSELAETRETIRAVRMGAA